MPTLPYAADEDRESQVLRASVVETAMTLGPEVTGWMFDNTVAEEDEDNIDQMRTPDLMSSASSEDSQSLAFWPQDGHTHPYSTPATSASVSRSNSGTRPHISHPTRLAPTPKTPLEKAYYLDSPFIVVKDVNFSRHQGPLITPTDDHISPAKRQGKGFRFTPRKRSPTVPQTVPAKQTKFPPISAPRYLLSGLDDPVPPIPPPSAPVLVTPPRATTPISTTSSLTRSSSAKLRKMGPGRTKDWDFKDPDRPSFFEQSTPQEMRTKKEKGRVGTRRAGDDDDAGYASEGTGRRIREKKQKKDKVADKDKDKDSPTRKRSMTSRLLPKWSTSDLREPVPPVPRRPPPLPLPLPIHERFATVDARADTPSPTPASRSKQTTPPYLSADAASVEPSPASSASSFTHMPDLNAAKRLGISNHGSVGNQSVGADNKMKLAMLAKLITDMPINTSESVRTQAKSPTGADGETGHSDLQPSPAFVVTSPTSEKANDASAFAASLPPGVLKYYAITPRSSAIPTTSPPSTTTPSTDPSPVTPPLIRGRQAPFPTKPIFTSLPRTRPLPPYTQIRFLEPPKRYMDVPRSVRSSYSKDLEREEGRDERDSDELDVMRSDVESRASFMDVAKSTAAREMLVKGVGVGTASGTSADRWL